MKPHCKKRQKKPQKINKRKLTFGKKSLVFDKKCCLIRAHNCEEFFGFGCLWMEEKELYVRIIATYL